MNLLAIDTSSANCSVALRIGGDIQHLLDSGPAVHAQRLLAMIDELLSKSDKTLSDIDLLVCGIGPGSFTGLRVGVGVAQGLAYSVGLKVLGINSLLGYLSADLRPGNYAVAVDARMGQLYNAGFKINDDDSVSETTETLVCNPGEVNKLFGQHHTLVGSGWNIYSESLPALIRGKLDVNVVKRTPEVSMEPTTDRSAKFSNSKHLLHWASIKLASGEMPLEAERLVPFYVRNNVVDKPKSIT
jgi:tRNA threonylcarbamoyladenosine biosynthesis protein TsaB